MRLTTADALESRMLLSGSTAGISIAEVDTANGLFTTQVPLPAGAENGQMLEIVSPPTNGSAYIQYGYHATPGPSDQIIYVASGTGGNETFTVRLRDNTGNILLHTIQVNNAGSALAAPSSGNGPTASFSNGSGSGSGSGWGGSGSGTGSGSGSGTGSGWNTAPTAHDGTVYTIHDQVTTGTFSGQDWDYDLLSISVSSSSLGSLSLGSPYQSPWEASTTLVDYTFTPNPGATGSETLTLTVSDQINPSVTALVYISVGNNVPEPVDDWNYTSHETPVTGSVAENDSLAANSSGWTDYDGDAIEFVIVSPPVNGSLVFDTSTGEYTYTPNPGHVTSDQFAHELRDGVATSTQVAVVDLFISCLPHDFGDLDVAAPEVLTGWYQLADVPTANVEWGIGNMPNKPPAECQLFEYSSVSISWQTSQASGGYGFYFDDFVPTSIDINLSPKHGSHNGLNNGRRNTPVAPEWPTFANQAEQAAYLADSLDFRNTSGSISASWEYKIYQTPALSPFNPALATELGGPSETPHLTPSQTNNETRKPNRQRIAYRTGSNWTEAPPQNWYDEPAAYYYVQFYFSWTANGQELMYNWNYNINGTYSSGTATMQIPMDPTP